MRNRGKKGKGIDEAQEEEKKPLSFEYAITYVRCAKTMFQKREW
jgi:hypothetical protein